MYYITPDRKISHSQWLKGFSKVLENGTREELQKYVRQTKPPLERDIAGIRYISLDAAVNDRFCSRKRAYALARDPRYSIITEEGYTMLMATAIYDKDIQLTT